MVRSEFLRALKGVRESFAWSLKAEVWDKPERRSRPRLRIRGQCKYGSVALLFDPIGAVCYLQTGYIFSDADWLSSAKCIELSLIDAADLTAAANDRGWSEDAGARKRSADIEHIRQELADCLGLNLNGPQK